MENKQKREEILLSPVSKALIPSENMIANGQHKDATNNLDYLVWIVHKKVCKTVIDSIYIGKRNADFV